MERKQSVLEAIESFPEATHLPEIGGKSHVTFVSLPN